MKISGNFLVVQSYLLIATFVERLIFFFFFWININFIDKSKKEYTTQSKPKERQLNWLKN